MTEKLIDINIKIHPTILYKCISLFLDKNMNEPRAKLNDNDNILRGILMEFLQTPIEENLKIKILTCIKNENTNDELLKLLELSNDNKLIQFLGAKINTKKYASIYEDNDFYVKLLNEVIISHNKCINSDSDESSESFDIESILDEYNKEKPVLISSANLQMLNFIDDNKFDQMLISIGMNEDDIIKAKKIKSDIKNNKPLNMKEIMTFIEGYKNNIASSDNPMIKNLLSIFGITETETETVTDNKDNNTSKNNENIDNIDNVTKNTEQQPMNFDMNNIINMMGPLISGLTQQGARGGKKGKGKQYRGRR